MSFLTNRRKISFLLSFALLLSCFVRADGPPVPPSTNSPFVTIMIIIIIILGLAIVSLANVLLGAAQMSRSNPADDPSPEATVRDSPADSQGNVVERQDAPDDKHSPAAGLSTPASIITGVILAGSLFLSSPVRAEDKADVTAASSSMVNGVSDTAFYMITGVVFLEVAILLALLYNVWLILSIYKKKKTSLQSTSQPAVPRISWWEKINRFKPVEQELSLDLGHDYDGIRELDNRLPPWWLYGFYCTILFAGVYLWRYHVSHSAPLSGEEYRISVAEAEVRKAAYLKKAANNIDENTVKLLTGADDLAAGKAVFQSTCFACHGKEGEGGVGPNLTDEYWLHGGSIQDVFKTIKYGWPDKGMKSWKDDYSPSQIAQIASYVKSLGGTHPANPKAPQGVIYK